MTLHERSFSEQVHSCHGPPALTMPLVLPEHRGTIVLGAWKRTAYSARSDQAWAWRSLRAVRLG